ncbi:MAG: DUF2284 domain-containing protein [Desulfobulbaceae bacterium]|jgi:predicted metal-binding protein|nr:DUF2284 domain-containing protein [Desulfobulbaceae bacterium]
MMPTIPSELEALMARACALGATAAAIIPAGSLVVEENLASLCGAPYRCPSYGLAPGCPPHAMQPEVFRELLFVYQQALVFKIEAPVAALLGQERLEIARRIHNIAATIEQEALAQGWRLAKGLAAGSCKELFCPKLAVCVVLDQGLECPHAERARPSLSALGVNFSLLTQAVGWQFEKIQAQAATAGEPAIGLMAGLVLLA